MPDESVPGGSHQARLALSHFAPCVLAMWFKTEETLTITASCGAGPECDTRRLTDGMGADSNEKLGSGVGPNGSPMAAILAAAAVEPAIGVVTVCGLASDLPGWYVRLLGDVERSGSPSSSRRSSVKSTSFDLPLGGRGADVGMLRLAIPAGSDVVAAEVETYLDSLVSPTAATPPDVDAADAEAWLDSLVSAASLVFPAATIPPPLEGGLSIGAELTLAVPSCGGLVVVETYGIVNLRVPVKMVRSLHPL